MCVYVCTVCCEPGIFIIIHSSDRDMDTGTSRDRGNGQDMQATASSIIDPRAGLSTAPLPLSSTRQTVSNVHAAMQAMSWPLALGPLPMRLTIFIPCASLGLG